MLLRAQLGSLHGSARSLKTGHPPRWGTPSACRTRRATIRLSVPAIARVPGKHRAIQRIVAALRQDSEDRIAPRTSLANQSACLARTVPLGPAGRTLVGTILARVVPCPTTIAIVRTI